ncbi:MAG: type IX secretion system outer membrane channel protein PorV [Flavobacteriaceae bacterium]|nr:type IX secretion system outer membrane channel protein PorV [Flavobacteriaceae bacterium]
MKRISVFSFLLFSVIGMVNGQGSGNSGGDRTITTAVPFLLVTSDARSAGMGDVGVATSTDAYSQYWNPAKYAFLKQNTVVGVSYTPYLADLVNDISLINATFAKRINENSAFGIGLRYFGLGEIELRNQADGPVTIAKPNELALDGSYSLKLSEHFAMSIAGRYIRSNLKLPLSSGDTSAANSFGVDVGAFYEKESAYANFNGIWRFGFNISNIGPKINYDNDVANDVTGDFLPTNLKIGSGFDFLFDGDSRLGIHAEFNKLLVPTPQDFDGDGDIDVADKQEYNKESYVSGMFKSFGDAPDGFSEELQEFTWALGAEYNFQDSFAFRAGYFNEAEEKGARRFFTLGAGFRFNVGQIDVSYLFSSSNVKNPLENTLRFSLSFYLGERYD